MFSNSCQYAIRAALYLALKSDEEDKMKVDEIAEALDISKPFLAKILQQLTRYQIISSLKGRNGGFYLTKENRLCSLLSIVEAMEGSIKLQNCILGLETCSDKVPCPYHFAVSSFRKKFHDQLGRETIDFCAKRIEKSNLRLSNKS